MGYARAVNLPRLQPRSLIDLLREEAETVSYAAPGLAPEETLEAEAAMLLTEMTDALERIERGAADAPALARAALNPVKPVRMLNAADSVRRLLREG